MTIPGTMSGNEPIDRTLDFRAYPTGEAYDEMLAPERSFRSGYLKLVNVLASSPISALQRRKQLADATFVNKGITFNVYNDTSGSERIFPFDILPRVITTDEWNRVAQGIKQRVRALNCFLQDIYGDEKILRDGVVPVELVYSCPHFLPEMRSVELPNEAFITVSGSDLIRRPDGSFVVLEDNLRVPSGVSYMLSNRQICRSSFPTLFRDYRVLPIENYPGLLLRTLQELRPPGRSDPNVVLLTPGPHNSAYFEHAFLARQMGIELVMGRDLLVHDNVLYMRTTSGLARVDVIYRRIDDAYLDPLIFRSDSLLGVPGLFNCYRAGNVNICNALGAGVADDKAIYAYVPAMIRYYLDEDPILENVETYLGHRKADLDHILQNIEKLVVKSVGGAGGHGMLIGPHATREECETFRDRVRGNPRNYIAQPTIQLSSVPCFFGDTVDPRHVDLRPFCLLGKEPHIVPGGLSRVALTRGSLVVNSSQGGGSKDTWIVATPEERTAERLIRET